MYGIVRVNASNWHAAVKISVIKNSLLIFCILSLTQKNFTKRRKSRALTVGAKLPRRSVERRRAGLRDYERALTDKPVFPTFITTAKSKMFTARPCGRAADYLSRFIIGRSVKTDRSRVCNCSKTNPCPPLSVG